jgi:hypothetical protein
MPAAERAGRPGPARKESGRPRWAAEDRQVEAPDSHSYGGTTVADPITYSAAPTLYHCGSDFWELKVIIFKGPNDSKACAYCCNMNLDFDGEPQAYVPLTSALEHWDNLGDAGFLDTAKNAQLKGVFDGIKSQIDALKRQRAAAKTPKDAEVLQRQITALESADIITNYQGAKNYGKIFWNWYGVMSLTPDDARKVDKVYHERVGTKVTPRYPILANDPKAGIPNAGIYEDVYGRFPVVQSEYEPGKFKGYFVTVMPNAQNTSFKDWDQRYYLPPAEVKQGPYAALTVPNAKYPGIPSLAKDTGLQVGDSIFAMRLDQAFDLTFPFRDTGYGAKVAECSIEAFTGLGGTIDNTQVGWAKYPNNFPVLYLAFPRRQTPQSVMTNFASATNAMDFPMILAFMAQVTAAPAWKKIDGQASKVPSGDALVEFKKLQKLAPDKQVRPIHFGNVTRALKHAGFDLPNTPFYSPGDGPIPVP